MAEIVAADLRAIADVANALAEESDGLSAQSCIELLREAKNAALALRTAIGLLEAQALKTLEQPIIIGDTAYSRKREIKRRPDQGLITNVVTRLACAPTADGEVPTAFDAAANATTMMFNLYVSPSTLPKAGGVKALGITMDDVTTEEHTGYTLKETEL